MLHKISAPKILYFESRWKINLKLITIFVNKSIGITHFLPMRSVFYWILRRIFKYCAPLIRLLETKKLRKYGCQELQANPVFIVGLPRSGSTFVYQVLTDMFDVSFIDNLMTLGRETLYFSTWLSNLFFRGRMHHSYTSTYGNTWESGLHAPSEAGALWYRWIPDNAVYVDENSLSKKNRVAMALNISALINRYKKPLLIKNLYFSTRIRLIHALFPTAKFILVKREPLFIAQSIYLSRLENSKNPEFDWWSVKFPGYESLLGKPLEEQVARQVYELERLLKRDLAEVNAEFVIEVNYETMDMDYLKGPLFEFIGSGYRKGFVQDQMNLAPGNKQKVDVAIFERLQRELDHCYNDNE